MLSRGAGALPNGRATAPNPLSNRLFQLVQLIIKEMSRAFDDLQFHWTFDLCRQLTQARNVTELVSIALDEQNWLAAFIQEIEIVLVDRSPDADQPGHPLVRHSYFQPYARAERKTAQRDLLSRIIVRQIIQARTRIVAFATAFVMLAGALPDAAKVYAQGHQACVIERGGSTKDDFVVHRAPEQWMRVQHQSGPAHWTLGSFQNGFQLSMLSRDEKISCWIHNCLRLPMCDCRFTIESCQKLQCQKPDRERVERGHLLRLSAKRELILNQTCG